MLYFNFWIPTLLLDENNVKMKNAFKIQLLTAYGLVFFFVEISFSSLSGRKMTWTEVLSSKFQVHNELFLFIDYVTGSKMIIFLQDWHKLC